MLALVARGPSAPKLSGESLLSAIAPILDAETDLLAVDARELAAAQDLVERCAGSTRFTCWSRAVRGAVMLLVVSVSREGDADLVSLVSIDTKKVDRLYDEADHTQQGWENRLEDAVFQSASSASLTIGDDPELGAKIFSELRAALNAANHLVRYGRIEVRAGYSGVAIALDNSELGETAGPMAIIRNVRPGSHRVKLIDRAARIASDERTIDVRAGEVAIVESSAIVVEPPGGWMRPATFWSGVGLAAIGAAITVLAVAGDPGPELFDACVGEGCRGRAGFASLCEVTSRDVSCLQGSKGVLAAPLGYSLLLTGAAWSLGEQVDESLHPAWVIGAGLALGAIAYGVSVIADDETRAR